MEKIDNRFLVSTFGFLLPRNSTLTGMQFAQLIENYSSHAVSALCAAKARRITSFRKHMNGVEVYFYAYGDEVLK